jgi:hypothetical protein
MVDSGIWFISILISILVVNSTVSYAHKGKFIPFQLRKAIGRKILDIRTETIPIGRSEYISEEIVPDIFVEANNYKHYITAIVLSAPLLLFIKITISFPLIVILFITSYVRSKKNILLFHRRRILVQTESRRRTL